MLGRVESVEKLSTLTRHETSFKRLLDHFKFSQKTNLLNWPFKPKVDYLHFVKPNANTLTHRYNIDHLFTDI